MGYEVAMQGGNDLLALAIQKGVDTDMLEKLIALKNAELERQAKAEFAQAFARMQAEFRPVGKGSKAVDQNGRTLYSYCPIEVILAMAAPIMARHGFSYRWTEEALPTKEKRINCIVSGYGWSETSFVDIPYMDPVSKATNVVQMRGSATTYGKRYSFLNATGIIVGGEDDDARGADPSRKVDSQPMPSDNPDDLVRSAIKAEIARFVSIMGSERDGEPMFSDEEKQVQKGRIAALPSDLSLKLEILRQIVDDLDRDLQIRQGKTPLAEAVLSDLKGRNAAKQLEVF